MAIERIQLRRGTASQWTDTDPILGAAEIGVELGTPNKFKIGDGSSTWSELDYFTVGTAVDAIPTSEKGAANGVATLDANSAIPISQLANIIDSAPETLNTLNELAAALADDADFATTITTELANKADASHTHTKSQITDFVHTHVEADITDLGAYTELTDFSVTTASASSNGSLSYDNTTGVFTFTPPEPAAVTPNIKSVTTTTYGTLAEDANSIIAIASASAVTVTVNDVFAVGESATVYKRDLGIITFTAGSGVTLEGAGTSGVDLKITNTYSAVTIVCLAAGEYAIIGDVEIA